MFNGMLGSNKNPNQNRYNRLIALSASQIIMGLPVAFFSLYVNVHHLTVNPWISWDNTHSDYSFVGEVPSSMWRADPVVQAVAELTDRWIVVVSAFAFFAFFGFAEEARRNYRKAYSFATSTLRMPDFRKSGNSSSQPCTPSSSFGHSFKFSAFKNSFSSLGSTTHSKSETITNSTTAERKDSFLVSEYRLTSSSSIFEGVGGNAPKALEILPGDDNSQLTPTPAPAPAPAAVSRSALEALAAVTNFPAPPPPIARVSIRSLPPGLFPHSPTASDLYLDPSETA